MAEGDIITWASTDAKYEKAKISSRNVKTFR
jgi:hypothetical protein